MLLLLARPSLAGLAILAPCVVLLVAWAATGDRSILVLGSLAISIGPTAMSSAVSVGGAKLYPQDALVAIALIGWVVETTLLRGSRESSHRRLVVGLATAVFSAAVLASLLRGHAAYGLSYTGQPLRLVLYIGVAAALLKADPATLFRRITIVLYAGVVWQLIAAIYHILTGTSQSTSADLSTGGYRVVSILTSLFVVSALFAAVANLEREQPVKKRLLHLAIVMISLVEIVLAFSRGTFIATALGLVALFAVFRRARGAFISTLPLVLPLLLATAFFLPQLETRPNEPSLVQTLIQRLDPHVNNDLSVEWRAQANKILWDQVRSNPLVGVGFGKGGQFTLAGVEYHITQDAHNDYLFLCAAGGILLLGSFLALVANSALQLLRIARSSKHRAHRPLIGWALATLFMLLFNGLVEPLIVLPSVLLTLWILILLPIAFQDPHEGSPARPRLLLGRDRG
ncbi:MAG: O-antigen ligase family protein [Gaiellaceae bacterium]